MEQAFEQFIQTMGIKNFSESTKKSYGFELRKYLQYCTNNRCEYNSTTFQEFLFYRIKRKQISECSLKHSIGAANTKHYTILMLLYSSGLRVSEIVSLTVDDVIRDKMLLRVNQSKGKKDRYTILSHITNREWSELLFAKAHIVILQEEVHIILTPYK